MCWPIHHSTTLTGVAHSFETTAGGNSARRRRATPTSPGCSTSCTTLRLGGTAGFVLANGSMSSNQSGEGEIRKNIIEAGLVDCIIALPGQLFRSTQIPACLWFLSKSRRSGERRGETLFIDARKLGHMLDRTRRDLSVEDISRVAGTYYAWLGRENNGEYADVPGFCKSASLDEIRKHGHVLTPGRYVGVEPQPDDGVPFADKMARLSVQWREQQVEARRLDAAIEENLARLGFGE